MEQTQISRDSSGNVFGVASFTSGVFVQRHFAQDGRILGQGQQTHLQGGHRNDGTAANVDGASDVGSGSVNGRVENVIYQK